MQREEMKRVVRRHIELSWNKGHLHLIGHLHSPNFLYKSSFVGHALNGEGLIAMVEQIRDATPDLEIIEGCIAENEQMASPNGAPLGDFRDGLLALRAHGSDREICTMFDRESFRPRPGRNSAHSPGRPCPGAGSARRPGQFRA